MTEKGCWNCRWENLDETLDPCDSCYMFDSWEKNSEFKEKGE